MFSDSNKNGQSSEFGLYRYHDCDEDYLTLPKKRKRFGCFVILLTFVIVLSSVSLVVYNHVWTPDTILPKPIYTSNTTKPQLLTPNYHFVNLSYTKEIINEKETHKNKSDLNEIPHALEIRNINSNFETIDRISGQISPRPFIYEMRDPRPTGFQSFSADHRVRKESPKKAKNIQEIIKYLTENSDKINRSKRPQLTDSKQRKFNKFSNSDPFFPYKPQNPSDINLLAMNGLRFAPTIQLEASKIKTTTESYPNYEKPVQNIKKKVRNKKNYTKLNSPGYDYNFYNNYHPNSRNQNRSPYWNQQQNLPNQQLNYQNFPYQIQNYQQNHRPIFRPPNDPDSEPKQPSQMIVHLNLYPKKKSKPNHHHHTEENCTEDEHETHAKNTNELNHILQNIRNYQSSNEQSDLITILKQNNNHKQDSKPVELIKSIGFTVLAQNQTHQPPTQSEEIYYGEESQWHPMIINPNTTDQINDNYHEYINKLHQENIPTREENQVENESINNNDYTPTLPMTYEEFEKYFATQSTPKYNNEWDPDTLRQNPNLINHKAFFRDRKRRKENDE